MDPQFQRSFIPKKPITVTSTRVPSTVNLFALVAIVLFIVCLGLSGAVFFYNNLLAKQIEDNKASLDRAKGAFEPELIQQIIRRDTRIETAKSLLEGHISVTPLFDYLSTVTLKSVRFRDFNFSYLASDKIQITMRAQGQSYAAVALESDLLNSQKNLHNTILSGMSLDPAGTVSFSVSTTIDPGIFSYATSVSGRPVDTGAPASVPTSPANVTIPAFNVSTTSTPQASTSAAASTSRP